MKPKLTGLHHLTAVTAHAAANFAFYTQTLGMRLVKKTVNQDDVRAYHLFYADGHATPGSDLTFFDWPTTPPEQRGSHTVTRTGLRVGSAASVTWWAERLQQLGVQYGEVTERDGRVTLDFEDFEGQRLSLIDDGGAGEGAPWPDSPVATKSPGSGLSSRIGTWSGVASIIPAQTRAGTGRPRPGKAAAKSAQSRSTRARLGGGSSTRMRSNGLSPSSAQRRAVVQASG